MFKMINIVNMIRNVGNLTFLCFLFYSTMFAVLKFPNEENSLAVVSKSWCTKKRCYWPPYKTQERLRKAVILHEVPDINTWEVFSMEILTYMANNQNSVFPRRNPKYDQTDSEESDTAEQPFPPAPKPPSFITKTSMCNTFFLGHHSFMELLLFLEHNYCYFPFLNRVIRTLFPALFDTMC